MLFLKKFYNLYSLRDVWNQLYREQLNEVTPFLSYDYNVLLWRYYLPYCIVKKGYPVFYVFYSLDRPVLLMPVFKFFSSKKGWALFGDVNGCNYCDVIAPNKEYLIEAIEIMSNEGLSNFNLSKIKESSGTIDILKSLTIKQKVTENVQIKIPNIHDDYIKSLSKSTRQNIRTGYNRLEKQGLQYNIKVFRGGEQFDYRPMLKLYVHRHLERYGVQTGTIKKWALLHYNFSTKSFLQLTNAMTIVLYIGDEVAAFMSGLIGPNNEFVVPRLSIDSRFSFFSPGILLINESIKYFIEKTDIKNLDLSQGEEEYKYKMGGQKHLTYTFYKEE